MGRWEYSRRQSRGTKWPAPNLAAVAAVAHIPEYYRRRNRALFLTYINLHNTMQTYTTIAGTKAPGVKPQRAPPKRCPRICLRHCLAHASSQMYAHRDSRKSCCVYPRQELGYRPRCQVVMVNTDKS